MFSISRESDYAVRVMVFLAGRPAQVISSRTISEAQHIPHGFLLKILQQLIRARFLNSRRGMNGGFQLAVDPHQTTLLQLVARFEKNFGLNRCVVHGGSCELMAVCAVHDVWVDAWNQVVQKLESVTLAQLAEEASARMARRRAAGENGHGRERGKLPDGGNG